MSANSVSALAYRAREGLRQAFLTMHLSDISETDCRWVNEHLGAFVRKGLSKRDAGKVQGHLDECRRCTAMYLELTDVNSNLAGIIAPLLLGAAATGYLASSGAGLGVGGLLGLVSRAKDFAAANTGAVAAGAVAAGVAVAAVAAVALGLVGRHQPDVTADRAGRVGDRHRPRDRPPSAPGAATASPSTPASVPRPPPCPPRPARQPRRPPPSRRAPHRRLPPPPSAGAAGHAAQRSAQPTGAHRPGARPTRRRTDRQRRPTPCRPTRRRPRPPWSGLPSSTPAGSVQVGVTDMRPATSSTSR